jgi:hypothetical protein
LNIRKSSSLVLWCELIGFGSLIALSWLDEVADFQQLVLGGPPHQGDWRSSTLDTLLILLVAGVVFLFTRRLLARLRSLEGFLRVCAWCRRICYEGKWVRMEDFFARGLEIETTHGMCPECFKRMEEDTAEFKRRNPAAAPDARKD